MKNIKFVRIFSLFSLACIIYYFIDSKANKIVDRYEQEAELISYNIDITASRSEVSNTSNQDPLNKEQ